MFCIAAGAFAMALGAALVPHSVSAAPPPVTLTLTSAKSVYTVGEPIDLTVHLTNTTASSCELSNLPDGTLSFVLFRRGGSDVPSSYDTFIKYDQSLSTMLLQSLVVVGPGGTLAYDWTSDSDQVTGGQAFHTVVWSASDNQDATFWSVLPPGDYELSATYMFPPVPGVPSDACSPSGPSAPAAFSVVQPAGAVPDIRFPGIMLIVALLAGAAATLVIRGRSTRRRAGTGALALAACVGLMLGGASSARAEIVVDPLASDAFKLAVKNCFQMFKTVDPSGIMAGLNASKNKHIIQESKGTNSETASNSKNGQSKADGGNGTGSGSTIRWDPTLDGALEAGVNRDPCASLYHELFHASEDDAGSTVYANAGTSGIPTCEVNATKAENGYRNGKGLPQRTKYGDKPLP